jgi:pimeloyl-ACP methyl ester carboxylesterase
MKNSTRIIKAVLILLFLTIPFGLSFAQTEDKGKLVSLNGIEMYYETHGQGDPVVLLHGWGGERGAWTKEVAEFEKHYHVIVPELRGHGRSTNPSKEFTFKQSAKDIFALADHLGLDTFKIMGHSAGAVTILHMATQQPDRIEAMVLIDGPHYLPEQARVIFRTLKGSSDRQTEAQWARRRRLHGHGDEQIRWMDEMMYKFKDSYDDVNFTPPYLSTIKAKTLIVWGDRDPAYPVSMAVEMYNSIPNSYLWVIPNGWHYPIGGKNAKLFAKTSLEFFQGAWD